MVLRAKETRAVARTALRGKWFTAVIAGLLVMLLGGTFFSSYYTGSTTGRFVIEDNNWNTWEWTQADEARAEAFAREYVSQIEDALRRSGKTQQDLHEIAQGLHILSDTGDMTALLEAMDLDTVVVITLQTVSFVLQQFHISMRMFLGMLLISALISLLFALIRGAVNVGYAMFNLHLVDGRDLRISNVFDGFSCFGRALLCSILQWLYIFLWALPGLLCMVGAVVVFFLYLQMSMLWLSLVLWMIGALWVIVLTIWKSYSYSMSYYVLADHDNVGANGAIRQSKQLMHKNKFRYFSLQLSFIGWAILCAFTCGIGYFFLYPYMAASSAVFYRAMVTPMNGYGYTAPGNVPPGGMNGGRYEVHFDSTPHNETSQDGFQTSPDDTTNDQNNNGESCIALVNR